MRAAQRAGVGRFVFFSALDASAQHRTRYHRAKAAAEQAVCETDLDWTVFAPSIVYAPGDAWLTLLERMALAPVMPMSGMGHARFRADLGRGRRRLRDGGSARARGRPATL